MIDPIGLYLAGVLQCGPVQDVVRRLRDDRGERIVAVLYAAAETPETPSVIVTQNQRDGAWTALTVVAGFACPAASGNRSAVLEPAPASKGQPS